MSEEKKYKTPQKILVHPDKEQIIKWMTEGMSIREIKYRLDQKYFKRKRLRLSIPTLNNFRKFDLKLDKKVLDDIRMAKEDTEREKEVETRLSNSVTYKDKINEIADTHLDVARKIVQLDQIIETRLEYWYNALTKGEASPSTADKEMRQYMDRQMVLLQQYKKFVEGVADKTVEHNVNITVLNDQLDMIKGVIKDVLRELDSETSIKFMDMFNKKLNSIQYSPQRKEDVDTKMLETINAEIIE